jgi:hypothetical protein
MLKVAISQWLCAQAASFLIVIWEVLESPATWGSRSKKCCFARPDPVFHKLTHLIYWVLKTRQPFDANWAKKAIEVVETAVSVVVPLKINALTLDFQGGICPR